MTRQEMSIDIETYSSVDLTKSGVYAYVQAPDFQILLFAYAFDDEPVQVVDLTAEALPEAVLRVLTDPDVIKTAYNANFERTCLRQHLGLELPIEQWRCSAVAAAELGLPQYLAGVAEALGLAEQKDSRGKLLINYFSKPCKPTAANGGRTRNLPEHDPDKWQTFKDYCVQDVEVERAVKRRIAMFPLAESEQKLWAYDQRINDRGVRVDRQVVQHAIGFDEAYRARCQGRAYEITGLDNVNSLVQLKGWIQEQTGQEVPSLAKEALAELRETCDNADVKEVLALRQEMSKTSTAKYEAMARSVCPDGRIRGLLQFYGAGRTGRWCLTGDHEVLTEKGWVCLDEWHGGRIACWHPSGETVSFQDATALAFPYEGDMYEYKDKRIAQKSTPEHKMYVKRRYDGAWGIDTVANMAAYRPSIPFTGYRRSSPGMEHSNLRVLVMTQADGHYTNEGDLRFHFSKQRKMERCKALLRSAGIAFNFSINGQNGKNVYCLTVLARHMPLWLRMFQDKTFGSWLLDESADVFFDELAYWDGYRSAVNSVQYSTCNKQNADIVQAFAHISGRCALMKTKRRSAEHPNWSDSYVLDIWMTPKNCHELKCKPEITSFVGKVYCAETQTGFFLVRREGRVWVTGNSGRLVQVQNLPQNHLLDLDYAREIVVSGDYELFQLLYGNPPQILSELIRTAFIPSEGRRFIVSDFSAIEARVVAYLAGEQWRLDVFEQGGDIYCASASQMFKVPVKKNGVNGHLRQKGKIAELALGYGGSVGALTNMGALKMGLTEDELPPLVESWRATNPRIIGFWKAVEKAAMDAVRDKPSTLSTRDLAKDRPMPRGLSFRKQAGILFIGLPSGRRLAYVKPRIGQNRFGSPSLTYMGMNQTKRTWERLETFGGKLVENIVQAFARDCLAESIIRLEDAGYEVNFHVHDEVVLDVPEGWGSAEEVAEIMGQPLFWAPGLPLKAEAFETPFYKKD